MSNAIDQHIQNLETEIFTIRYEMETLAEWQLSGQSERWLDGFSPQNVTHHHRARYELAAGYVQNLLVLDIACGSGCGSSILVKQGQAREVIGVDIDPDAIKYANFKYGVKNCRFINSSIEEWDDHRNYDVAVSYETIEHLEKPDQFLELIRSKLSPSGIFFVSTPIAHYEGQKPTNRYHRQEWTIDGFQNLLKRHGFEIEKTWFQSVRSKRSDNVLFRQMERVKDKLIIARMRNLVQGDLIESLSVYRSLKLMPKFQVYLLKIG